MTKHAKSLVAVLLIASALFALRFCQPHSGPFDKQEHAEPTQASEGLPVAANAPDWPLLEQRVRCLVNRIRCRCLIAATKNVLRLGLPAPRVPASPSDHTQNFSDRQRSAARSGPPVRSPD
jgi:hypothetical protein